MTGLLRERERERENDLSDWYKCISRVLDGYNKIETGTSCAHILWSWLTWKFFEIVDVGLRLTEYLTTYQARWLRWRSCSKVTWCMICCISEMPIEGYTRRPPKKCAGLSPIKITRLIAKLYQGCCFSNSIKTSFLYDINSTVKDE